MQNRYISVAVMDSSTQVDVKRGSKSVLLEKEYILKTEETVS